MSLLAETDDAGLLKQVRDGDTSAMAELWSRHYPATLAAARRISRQPRDAEELASDAFTAMLQALSHDAGPSTSVRAYLLTAVRNQATSRARRSSSGDVLTDEIADYEDGDRDVIDPVAHHAELGLVREAFASLPHRWQTVLWRTAVDHDSNKAVAADLGMTPNALAALARRARLGFRTAYLQVHSSSGAVAAACVPFIPRLVELLPGAKPGAGVAEVRSHVAVCEKCTARLAELQEVDRDLRGLLLPALLALGPGIKWATAAHLAGAGTVGTAGALWSKLGLQGAHASKVVGVGTAAAVTVAGATAAYALTRPTGPEPTHHVTSAAPVARDAAGVVPPPPLATSSRTTSASAKRSAPVAPRSSSKSSRTRTAAPPPPVVRTTSSADSTSRVSPSSLPRVDRTSTPPRSTTTHTKPSRSTTSTSSRTWTPKPTRTTSPTPTSTPTATGTTPPPTTTATPSSSTTTSTSPSTPPSTTTSSPTSTVTTPPQPWRLCYELPDPLDRLCVEFYKEYGHYPWTPRSSSSTDNLTTAPEQPQPPN